MNQNKAKARKLHPDVPESQGRDAMTTEGKTWRGGIHGSFVKRGPNYGPLPNHDPDDFEVLTPGMLNALEGYKALADEIAEAIKASSVKARPLMTAKDWVEWEASYDVLNASETVGQ